MAPNCLLSAKNVLRKRRSDLESSSWMDACALGGGKRNQPGQAGLVDSQIQGLIATAAIGPRKRMAESRRAI
jgi:hypothetical protein